MQSIVFASLDGYILVGAGFSLRLGRNLKVAATPLTECLTVFATACLTFNPLHRYYLSFIGA